MINVQHFFHESTSTLSYVVWAESGDAVVIDSALDYNADANSYTTEYADSIVEFCKEYQLRVHLILETHIHADHLTAGFYLKEKLNASTAIGECMENAPYDIKYADGDVLQAGELAITAVHTPGHTPCDFVFKVDNMVFTGDTIFMPDFGTGRCDFPNGSADALYTSITEKLYSLPDDTVIYVGHDYQPNSRELQFKTTVQEQKNHNIHVRHDTSREDFVKFRTQRDATLQEPKLLHQSIQFNSTSNI